MAYRLNEWYLSSDENVTPKAGDHIDPTAEYVEFNIDDLNLDPLTYVYRVPSSTDNGNSVEIVAELSDEDSGSYLTMFIDDGTNCQGIKIYKGYVTLLAGQERITIENSDENEHRYTITLRDGKFMFFFDKRLCILTTDVHASLVTEGRVFVGFPEFQGGSLHICKYKAKFRYIKYADCEYKYINLSDLDFEFELDSSPLFNTINHRVYNKSDFDIPPTPVFDTGVNPETKIASYNAVYSAWTPISYVCGKPVTVIDPDTGEKVTKYDGSGLVTSIALALPQKQDMSFPMFFYRVRLVYNDAGNYVPLSGYSNTYFEHRLRNDVGFKTNNPVYYENIDEPVEVNLLSPYVFVYDGSSGIVDIESIVYSSDDFGDHFIAADRDGAAVLLPELPVSDDWQITLYNVGDFSVEIEDYLGGFVATVAPGQAVTCVYDSAHAYNWTTYLKHDVANFTLQADVASEVFNAVYNSRIPAYDYVYTKELSSGNIANIVRAESKEVGDFFSNLEDQENLLNLYSADNDLFTERYSNIFNIPVYNEESGGGGVFSNRAEARDAFQVILLNLTKQLRVGGLSSVIAAITGSKPEITEYKDVPFNVIWSHEEAKTAPDNLKFYLYDPKCPSYITNPFVPYGQTERYSTFQVDIFNPYNIEYKQELIKQVIKIFKPAWTRAIINFYDSEGMPIEEKIYYWYADYLRSEYNK